MVNKFWKGWLSGAGILCMVLCFCGGNAWAGGGLPGDGPVMLAQSSVPRSSFQGPEGPGEKDATPAPSKPHSTDRDRPPSHPGGCPEIRSVEDYYPNSSPVDDPSLPEGMRVINLEGCPVDLDPYDAKYMYARIWKPGFLNMLRQDALHGFFMESLDEIDVNGTLFMNVLERTSDNTYICFYEPDIFFVADETNRVVYSLNLDTSYEPYVMGFFAHFAYYSETKDAMEVGCLDEMFIDELYQEMPDFSSTWAPEGSRMQPLFCDGACIPLTKVSDRVTGGGGIRISTDTISSHMPAQQSKEFRDFVVSHEISNMYYYESGYVEAIYFEEKEGFFNVLVFPAADFLGDHGAGE